MWKKITYIPALVSPYAFLIVGGIIKFDLWKLNTDIDNQAFELLAYFVSFLFYVLISKDAGRKIFSKKEILE